MYIHILIIIALDPLLTFILASTTVPTAASTTAHTSCALLIGLLDLGLVTGMQEIWSFVFATTVITGAFSLGHAVSMVIWDFPLVGNIQRVEGFTLWQS